MLYAKSGMATHGCVNGTALDESFYSSPMPFIGIYIAVTTLVCFLFLLRDIWLGRCEGKPWLPCGGFSLNSFMLTLFSIVAKIAGDLTTSMPSSADQLSKLTGTTMICVCMAFFLPSIGNMRRSECFSNMYALTIFVITIIVDTGIQVCTGVIFSFRIEHFIVLGLMLFLLFLFWCCTVEVHNQKNKYTEHIRDLLLQGEGMMRNLELCHVYCSMFDSQLVICINPYSATLGLVSTACTVVLSEATVRSFFVHDVMFCRGVSDYKGSMLFVVVAQIGTVILAFMGNLLRWINLVPQMNNSPLSHTPDSNCGMVSLVLWVKTFINNVSVSMIVVLCATCSCFCKRQPTYDEEITVFQEEYKRCNIEVDKWLLDKGLKDLRQLQTRISSETDSQNPLEVLFPRSEDRIRTTVGADSIIPRGYRPTSLSLILLSQKAARLLTEENFKLLYKSLVETFDTVCFIDEKANVLAIGSEKKLVEARSMWKKMKRLMESGVDELSKNEKPSQQDEARFFNSFIKSKINPRDHEGQFRQIQQMQVQQLFVDILNRHLVKLPRALLKHVLQGSPEDYKESIKFSIESIYKLRSIEHKVKWKPLDKTNIKYLISSPPSSNNVENPTQASGNVRENQTQASGNVRENLTQAYRRQASGNVRHIAIDIEKI